MKLREWPKIDTYGVKLGGGQKINTNGTKPRNWERKNIENRMKLVIPLPFIYIW